MKVALYQAPGGGSLSWGSHEAAKRAKDSGFHTVVLCAEEHQDRDQRIEKSGVRVFRWGFEDDFLVAETSQKFRDTVFKAGVVVASQVRKGRRVLVTCAMGINRSPLIAASAYRERVGKPGKQIIADMKRVRPDIFLNPGFQKLVESW